MRRLAGLCMLIATPLTAIAHEMAGEPGILERISHEFVGLHHLPITFVLVVSGVVLFRLLNRRASRTR